MTRSTNIIARTKKFAITTAIALVTFISYSFAGGTDELSSNIRIAFQKDFQNAQIINAEVKTNFTKVTFKMNNSVMYAFYTGSGELLAVTRNILSSQLPVTLQINLKKDYHSYWVTDLFELSGDGLSTYYVTLENADFKVTLRSDGDDNWEVYERKTK